MTGGGDLDEGRDDVLDEEDDVTDEDDDVVDDVDELGDGAADGDATTPTGFATEDINENDLDPTAGASDIGGVAGGTDEDATAPGQEGKG